MGGIPNNTFAITERRQKALIMLSKGLNEKEIAMVLNVNQSTVCRDIKFIKKELQKSIESSIKEALPFEYAKCKSSMDLIAKECWNIYQDKSGQWTTKNKIDALKLLKETNGTKLEMLQLGPLSLRALQLEEEVKSLVEENEIPQRNYMNLGLPALKDQRNEDIR